MRTYLYSSNRAEVAVFALLGAGMGVASIAGDLGLFPLNNSQGVPSSLWVVPMAAFMAWLALASRWICKVRLEGGRLEVVGMTGRSKFIDLDQPFTTREVEGNRAVAFEIRQGATKVSIYSYLDDYYDLRRFIQNAESAVSESKAAPIMDLHGRTFYMAGPAMGWAVIALAAINVAVWLLIVPKLPESTLWICAGFAALLFIPWIAHCFCARFEVDDNLQLTQYNLLNRATAKLDLTRPFELRVDDLSTSATELVVTQDNQTISLSAANSRYDDLRAGIKALQPRIAK